MTDRLGALLQRLAVTPDEDRRAAIEQAIRQLAAQPERAEALVARVARDDLPEADADSAGSLLVGLLDTCRMEAENGKSAGRALIERLERAVGQLMTADPMPLGGRLRLSRAWLRAGLAAPEALGLPETEAADLSVYFDPAAMAEMETMLAELAGQVAGNDSAGLHEAMSEMLATLPPAARGVFIAQAASQPGAIFAGLATMWLLDPAASAREASAQGLTQRLAQGRLDAPTAARLVQIRPWLPEGPARDRLDSVIREARRRDIAGGAVQSGWKRHRALATLPDGSGSQSLMVAAQRGSTRMTAMLLLKDGLGVKDAFCLRHDSATEQRQLIQQMAQDGGGTEVALDCVVQAVRIALGDGLAQGLPPVPGLVEVAEVLLDEPLTPLAGDPRALCALADPEGAVAGLSKQALGRLVNGSRDWPEEHALLDTWFEDSDAVQQALDTARTARSRETALWQHLESRRTFWIRQIARAALTLRGAGHPDATAFAATATALHAGRPLRQTPVMAFVVDLTLEAWEARAHGAPSALAPGIHDDREDDGRPETGPVLGEPDLDVAPERPGELEALLAQTGISAASVEGVLTAVLVAPKPIRPDRWAEMLLGAALPEMPETAIERFLDLVLLRYHALMAALPDPEAVRAHLAGLSPSQIVDWADGFSAAQTRFKSAWPTKRTSRDDKAVLRHIASVGAGKMAAIEILPVLPDWLSHRFALQDAPVSEGRGSTGAL